MLPVHCEKSGLGEGGPHSQLRQGAGLGRNNFENLARKREEPDFSPSQVFRDWDPSLNPTERESFTVYAQIQINIRGLLREAKGPRPF